MYIDRCVLRDLAFAVIFTYQNHAQILHSNYAV